MIYATPISGVEFNVLPFWSLDADIRPRPQTRGRTFFDTRKKGFRTISNGKLVALYKRELSLEIASQQRGPKPDKSIPLMLEIEFGLPVKAKKLHGTLHPVTPDLDNLVKSTKDCLVDCDVIHDDGQITVTEAVKMYCAHPGFVRLRMSELDPI